MIDLYKQGRTTAEIAAAVGASQSHVSGALVYHGARPKSLRGVCLPFHRSAIIAAAEEGMPVTKIAKTVGVTYSMVKKVLADANLAVQGQASSLTAEAAAERIEMFRAGRTLAEIAERQGATTQAISAWLAKKGLDRPRNGKRSGEAKKSRSARPKAEAVAVTAAPPRHPSEMITPRQKRILAAIAAGQANEDIAASLGCAVGTIKVHLTSIFRALGVGDRQSAAREWARLSAPPAPTVPIPAIQDVALDYDGMPWPELCRAWMTRRALTSTTQRAITRVPRQTWDQ